MANADDQSTPAPHGGIFAFVRRLMGRQPQEPQAAPSQNGADLIEHAEAFQTLRVEDVMTPRVDVVAVDIATPFCDLIGQFIETEHSRLPVYRDTLDDPVGVVHVKDVFRLLAEADKRPADAEPILHRLRRDTLYVPASMRAADLLLRMQTTRIHLALVIDEFGGTDGLETVDYLADARLGDRALVHH